jgi:RpiB/LacA/LacB family sugar-phosphate isomerase
MNKPSIVIASDHAGFILKKEVSNYLWEKDLCDQITDIGCYNVNRCDYPNFAHQAIKQVTPNTYAILICGTGQGMAMTANKYPEVRAGVCYNTFQAQMIREHNNANVLCLGARCTSIEDARNIVRTFLTTEFSKEERHQDRINKMMNLK